VAKRRGGFTFVELLIVVALFAIIGVSLFQSFAMGLKVWKRASRPNFSYRKAVLTLERMARELRQSRGYPNTTFTGDRSQFSFATAAPDKAYNATYELKGDALWRGTKVLSAPWDPGEEREVVPGIADLEFTYYGYDAPTSSFIFFDEWDGQTQGRPMAVRVMMDLDDEITIVRRQDQAVIIVPRNEIGSIRNKSRGIPGRAQGIRMCRKAVNNRNHSIRLTFNRFH